MGAKRMRSIDELKVERTNLLQMFVTAKTRYVKDNLQYKIKSVNKELYTLTKEIKYL
jgi:transposase